MEKLETTVYRKFIGTYDLNDPLATVDLDKSIAMVSADNVDINKNYSLKFRNGRTMKLAGAYKNLWSNGSIYFATKGSNLYRIYPGTTLTESLIYPGISEVEMDYDNVGDLIYITDNLRTLVYENEVIRSMRTTTREFKSPMPGGHLISLYKSKMFLAKEVDGRHLIIQSEAANYERHDQRDDTSFQAFSSKLTMLRSVDDGLFISSDKIYFLSGSNLSNMKLVRVADYKAILGTAKKVKGVMVNGEYYSDAVIWESERGICIGGNGGKFINLTEGRKAKSNAVSGASYIKLGEINQFVVNTKGG